jgi:hypothetical protein
MMWNETVNANCIRASSTAVKSMFLSPSLTARRISLGGLLGLFLRRDYGPERLDAHVTD